MNNPTKEEISLCKQVAEKYRRDIEYGDCFYDQNFNEVRLLWDKSGGKIHARSQKELGVFFLWTISDCLEFLKKKCQDHVLLIHEKGLEEDEEWYLWFDEYKETQQWDKSKTALEACLKVVLAVPKERYEKGFTEYNNKHRILK